MAVTITDISGSITHDGTLSIRGSGFGIKPSAAPVIWDNCNHTVDAPSAIVGEGGWSGAWPDAGTAAYRMQYKSAPFRNISPPHNRVGKYMTGAHGENVGYNQGYNVMCYKSRILPGFPTATYASWYQRCDDNWVFGLNEGDSNFKTYCYSTGTSPYDSNYYYTELNPRPMSRSNTPGWHMIDHSVGLENSGNWWGSNAINPMAGAWVKVEHFIKISNVSNGGFLKIYENGIIKFNLTTRTDNVAGTIRNDGIGGFSRDSGNSNNYRYFADLYLDNTLQHIILGNASTLNACTVLEVQIPIEWSDSSITARVNRGKLTDNAAAYVYVYDANGVPNANGFPLSGSADLTPPGPPTNLRIQ